MSTTEVLDAAVNDVLDLSLRSLPAASESKFHTDMYFVLMDVIHCKSYKYIEELARVSLHLYTLTCTNKKKLSLKLGNFVIEETNGKLLCTLNA